jgi:hypothetical protein
MGPYNFSVEETLATPSSFVFNGQAAVTAHENALPAGNPWPADFTNDRLIQVEQGLHFHFKWSVSGPLVPILRNDLKWKVQVFLEKWGESETPVSPAATVNFNSAAGFQYNTLVNIPANTLNEGVYDVVAVIRLYTAAGNPLPVAGFVEMGKIQMYEQA